MPEAKITVVDRTDRVVKAASDAAFNNFSHAAARIRKDAIESIIKAEGPSAPGTPPHTRRNQLRNAIVFDANEYSAVIGPRYSRVGASAAAHEFGGRFKGQLYPERPFMFPAMEENLDRFAAEWKGSIGE